NRHCSGSLNAPTARIPSAALVKNVAYPWTTESVPRLNIESGKTWRYTAENASPTPGAGWNTFQNTASRPPDRTASVADAAPTTGSTQCQACPETTASKTR